MAFWEAFLIILGSVLAGLVISVAVIYGITRIQKKPFTLFPGRHKVAKEDSTPEPIVIPAAIETEFTEQEESSLEELEENRQITETIHEPTQLLKSEIFEELETNLGVATSPWSGKLTPFQTTFWDSNNIKNDPLLVNLQEEITQVYIDIRLANSIVWLSNEVGHRSSDLDESYKQLCVKIAERLKRVLHTAEKIK